MMFEFKRYRQNNRTFEIIVGCLVVLFSISGFILLWYQSNLLNPEMKSLAEILYFTSQDGQNSLWVRFFYELHAHLLMGPVGSGIVGLSGLAILAVSLTGLSRWVGWRRPQQGFRIRKTLNSRMLMFDIHNALGAASFLFLLIIGISGSTLSFTSLLNSLGVSPPERLSSMLKSLAIWIQILHRANYSSPISIGIYSLFGGSVMLVAMTGMAMGLRNIYRKYRRSLPTN